MYIRLLFAALLLASTGAFAQDSTSTASADVGAASQGRREIGLSPGVGYSDEGGWMYGLTATLAFPLTQRLQFEVGGLLYRKAESDEDRDASGVLAGPIFNLANLTIGPSSSAAARAIVIFFRFSATTT